MTVTGTATLERTNNTGKLYITDDADGTRRIKDWLTNWFKKRPPVETLRAKGIIQGETWQVKGESPQPRSTYFSYLSPFAFWAHRLSTKPFIFALRPNRRPLLRMP